jgi:hypothetical protein
LQRQPGRELHHLAGVILHAPEVEIELHALLVAGLLVALEQPAQGRQLGRGVAQAEGGLHKETVQQGVGAAGGGFVAGVAGALRGEVGARKRGANPGRPR